MCFSCLFELHVDEHSFFNLKDARLSDRLRDITLSQVYSGQVYSSVILHQPSSEV